MKRKNLTRNALVTSILSLLLCVSMLVGTTFAWFTDTATTGSNVIQSGKLDIVLEYWDGENWKDAEGEVLEFIKGGNYHGVVGDVLWEPGCTYQLPKIRVRNEGNLTAYTVLTINGITGDEKLLEAITFTTKVSNTPASLLTGSAAETYKKLEATPLEFMYGTPDGTVLMDWSLAPKGETTLNTGHTDTTAEFTISGHMKEEAGNEYQDLKIEGVSITVLATQGVYEYDSFGREYDKNATLPTVVTTADDLATALAEGGNIELAADIAVTEMITIPSGVSVTLDMNGKTISVPDGAAADPMIALEAGSSLVIDGNGTFNLNGNTGYNLLWPKGSSNATITIKSGNFLREAGNTESNYGFPFVVGESSCKLIIEGGYFDGGYYAEGDCDGICKSNLNLSTNQYVRVYGGTFVGQNPAWGDEGKAALCPHCSKNGSGCQGIFLEGQTTTSTELPEGYTIVEGTTADGRPTYTVNYSK